MVKPLLSKHVTKFPNTRHYQSWRVVFFMYHGTGRKDTKYFEYRQYIIGKFLLFLHILQNSVSCGADGLLVDAHDAADVAVFKAHLVEVEEDCNATLCTYRSG